MRDRERLINLINDVQDKGFIYPTEEEPSCNVNNTELADFLLANGVIVPPCKVGDYVEWGNGIGKNKRLHQIKGFYYEPENGLRYDLGFVCPIITHQAIKRIVPREEAEKALKGGAE